MTIGDRIKCIRIQKGVSQTELANMVGISKQAIYKYENNIVTNIPTDRVRAIAAALHVAPAEIMGWDIHINEVDKLPEEVQRIISLCQEHPTLAHALLIVAQQITTAQAAHHSSEIKG